MADSIEQSGSSDINTFDILQAVEKSYDSMQPSSSKLDEEEKVDQDSSSDVKLHHSVMRQKITDLKLFRSYIPMCLIIGMSEVGKSTLASILTSNPDTTTIFENWNDTKEWINAEKDRLQGEMNGHMTTDNELAKKMLLTVKEPSEKKNEASVLVQRDITGNRPRSMKFTSLIEATYDKFFLLHTVINPALEALQKNSFYGKKYKPGEIPVVYYNESLQDAIFHFDVFFLIATEGQESGGSRHRITLQERRKVIPKDVKSMSKGELMISGSHVENSVFGEKYITCFPVDIMVYFSLLGPVRVTSVNSSTFSSKNVVSNTQKGGLSDSVVNTPNYVSNTIRKFGGVMILEIRDDWDRADTLFGAGDMAMEITRNDNTRSVINKFRMRDGSLGKREYLATRNLYEIMFQLTLRCVDTDLESDFELLESMVSFMDRLIIFSNKQKLIVERMVATRADGKSEPSKQEMIEIEEFQSEIEDYITQCNLRGMSDESTQFTLMLETLKIN